MKLHVEIRRLMLLPLFLLTAFTCRAQTVFKLLSPEDFILAGVSIPLNIAGNKLYYGKNAMTEDEILLLDPQGINRFDRGATKNYSPAAIKASDVSLVTSLAVPVALLASEQSRKEAGTLGVIYLQVLALTTAEIQLVKGSVKRVRPLVYNPETPMRYKLEGDATASFFSGHTAMSAAAAFFTATAFMEYHPDDPAEIFIWSGAAALPLLTGYLRYRAGKHFPTDILTGLVLGTLNGVLVTTMHRQ